MLIRNITITVFESGQQSKCLYTIQYNTSFHFPERNRCGGVQNEDNNLTMKSAREKENERCMSSHHRRLLHALNLGTRSPPPSLSINFLFSILFINQFLYFNRHFDENTNRWKWQCANIEVHKNVLRSINAFLDSLSGDARAPRHTIVKVYLFFSEMDNSIDIVFETHKFPLFNGTQIFALLCQESAADILGALLWILQCKSEPLLSMASNVAVKLVTVLPTPLLQSGLLDLVYCLSSLLSSHQVEVAIPCATALNLIISNVSATSEKAVIQALKETDISICIVGNIKDYFTCGVKKIEYFLEMTSLLSTILLRWPSSRFPVCNDVELMKGLANMYTTTDSSIKLVLLKLYTSLGIKIPLSYLPVNKTKSISLLSLVAILLSI